MALSQAARDARYKPITQPTPREVSILRRVAQGYLLRTQTEKGEWFTYDDGTPITRTTKLGDQVDDQKVVAHMVNCGFLVGVPNETLPGIPRSPPQRYRARTPDDGPLPKFTRP